MTTRRVRRPKPTRRRRKDARPERALRLPRPGRRVWLALGVLALAAGVVAGARVGVGHLAGQPWLAIRTVEVEGVSRADVAEILARAEVAVGDRWMGLPADEIRFRIEGHPWVKGARVRRPWIGRVRLEISERVPLARVRVNGGTYGVADDLRMLPRLAPADSLLPELRGELDDEVLARGLQYAAALRDVGMAGREPLEVRLSDQPPDRIVLPRRGFSARIEAEVEPGAAVRNVAAFLETLDEEGEFEGTLRLISVETAVWKAAA